MTGREKGSLLPAAGIVTEIKAQKRHPTRVSIFIDGEFAFGVAAELCLKYNISTGELLDEQRIRRLLLDEELKTAENKAWRLLSGRAHSRRELEEKLRRYDFAEAVIAAVLQKLTDSGYLDDVQFARDFTRSRLQTRPMGKAQMRWELQQKGVPEALCEQVIEEYFHDDTVEIELAHQLYAKKKKQLRGQPPRKAREKMIRALLSRGFSRETIQAILDEDPDGLFKPAEEEHGFTDERNPLP